jgi:regulator of RNase E activity RraA
MVSPHRRRSRLKKLQSSEERSMKPTQFTAAVAASPRHWPKGMTKQAITVNGHVEIKFVLLGPKGPLYLSPGDWLVPTKQGVVVVSEAQYVPAKAKEEKKKD